MCIWSRMSVDIYIYLHIYSIYDSKFKTIRCKVCLLVNHRSRWVKTESQNLEMSNNPHQNMGICLKFPCSICVMITRYMYILCSSSQ